MPNLRQETTSACPIIPILFDGARGKDLKSPWKTLYSSQTRRDEMFFARRSSSLLSFSLCRSFRPSRGLDRTKETIRTIRTTGALVVAQRAVEAHRASAAVVAVIGCSSAGSASHSSRGRGGLHITVNPCL